MKMKMKMMMCEGVWSYAHPAAMAENSSYLGKGASCVCRNWLDSNSASWLSISPLFSGLGVRADYMGISATGAAFTISV